MGGCPGGPRPLGSGRRLVHVEQARPQRRGQSTRPPQPVGQDERAHVIRGLERLELPRRQRREELEGGLPLASGRDPLGCREERTRVLASEPAEAASRAAAGTRWDPAGKPARIARGADVARAGARGVE